MKMILMFALYILLSISSPSALAENWVVYDEMPLNFSWTVQDGSNGGKSLNIDNAHGGGQKGDYCVKIIYNRSLEDWASVFITATGDDRRGPGRGRDLSGAKRLIFYAKGTYGDEKVTFGYGLEPNKDEFVDSSIGRRGEILPKDYWQRYEFNLNDKDLSHMNGLFMFKIEKQDNPQGAAFYLDNITYIYDDERKSGVRFEYPANGSSVGEQETVSGTITGDLPNKYHLWVMASSQSSPKEWWPQGDEIEPVNGKWHTTAYIGTSGTEDIGEKYNISIIAVNEEDNKYLKGWVEETNKKQDWPSMLLPMSAKVQDFVIVTRGK